MAQNYGTTYHTYPVYSSDLGFEGAVKRYKAFPTPKDVFDKALMGLPKIFPLTQEEIEISDAAPYLENAVSEIEMSLNMDLSPVEHDQSFDYIDGMFESNFTGMKLERWPATAVTRLALKFPHTQTIFPGDANPDNKPGSYQSYTIPSGWVALRRNRLNVVAAFGAVSVQVGETNVVTAGGIFSYITGFGRGAYQPAIIECKYTAGFDNDKLPNSVWDLIVTLASLRMLEDIAAPLFPVAGVSVSVDSISQSANLPGPQLLVQKIESLQRQYTEKVNAVTRNFGRTIKMSFIGS